MKDASMDYGQRKETGSFYTPDVAARSLVRWAVRSLKDRLLDPSCGDGRFLALHKSSVGIEQDHRAARTGAFGHQDPPGGEATGAYDRQRRGSATVATAAGYWPGDGLDHPRPDRSL